jgi:hypothetical protein
MVQSYIPTQKSAPGHFGTYLHSQIGTYSIRTCHGQFDTSVKDNFVIIKYLYIKKQEKKVGFIS